MKNFIFKSTDADLQKMFQLFETIQKQLDIVNKNILYLTHNTDRINKDLKRVLNDKDLQETVDKYFDETSHQTERQTPEDLD